MVHITVTINMSPCKRAATMAAPRHLVFKKGASEGVTEADLCSRPNVGLLVWHTAISTALAESTDGGFTSAALAQAPRLQSVAATGSQVVGRHARLPEHAPRRISAPPEDASAGASRRVAGIWGDDLSGSGARCCRRRPAPPPMDEACRAALQLERCAA